MLLKNFTLLYVEDNNDMQNYMKSFLQSEVKEFYQAFNGQQGLEIYRDKKPNIILSDISMPLLDGLEMAEEIKKDNRRQPILLISAFQDMETLKKAINIGIDGFISKPIKELEHLLDMIEDIARHLQNEIDVKNLKKEEQKTCELKFLNLTLNKKVKEKTQELEDINKNLKDIIKTEVDKNRDKDKWLLHQARLVQMGEMISMIAHQWRQPLNAISARSANMLIKAQLGKLDRELVIEESIKIDEYSQDLSKTINDFRDFFKPNSMREHIDFCSLIKSVLGILETSITSKNIELILDLNCDDKFNVYPNEIRQVILNLVKNAEDALIVNKIKTPFIKIITYVEKGKYILEVSDNGGGISQKIVNKIFDPYFSTKSQKNGTGLGLYMSKIIIEEHCNGEIAFFNNKDGAVFKIIL